jgi:hypothetical protein
MSDPDPAAVRSLAAPRDWIEKAKLLVARFRALGGVPELCDLTWKLCQENERLEAELTDRRSAHAAVTQELETSRAQLRGMQDFLSGQPNEMPFRGGTGEAKESALNFAWTVGYQSARESDVFKLIVDRADRAAKCSDEAHTKLAALTHLLHLPRYEMEAIHHGDNTEYVAAHADVKGRWVKWDDIQTLLSRQSMGDK